MTRACVISAAVGLWMLMLGGCSATHVIKGKVIQGNLSFVAVVDQGDERLKSAGIADVDISARADVGKVAGYLFAQGETDAKGDFSMKFKDQSLFLKPVEISASKIGFQPATGSLSLPPGDRRILIILAPGAGGKPASPSGTR